MGPPSNCDQETLTSFGFGFSPQAPALRPLLQSGGDGNQTPGQAVYNQGGHQDEAGGEDTLTSELKRSKVSLAVPVCVVVTAVVIKWWPVARIQPVKPSYPVPNRIQTFE